MGTLATPTRPAPPVGERRHRTGSAPRLFEPGGVSLEESILRVWEDLTSSGAAACAVCGGRARAARACENCGSELA